MKMYVGITDYDWLKINKEANCGEVNFWKPGGKANFKALEEGELFLFKLHSPHDYIVGGGFFVKFSVIPASLAWEAFGISNGANDWFELKERIYKYRRTNRTSEPDPNIGCIILSTPFYFDEADWIPIPANWNRSIVQGKTYDTSEPYGSQLYQAIQDTLNKTNNNLLIKDVPNSRYGKEQIIKPRIGQGTFKVLITDAYHRRCAITGEKTLPVLEAAHIKPYSLNGPHEIYNGLLLRKDFHTLLDRGYITINKEYYIEVSHRIKDDFGNGREYYKHHGTKLNILPEKIEKLPSKLFLEWHNENIYLG